MLLQSQLPHGGSVADFLPGAGCSSVLRCLHNSHSCTVLSNILSICSESLFFSNTFCRLVRNIWTYPFSLRLNPSSADMLFCCCLCLGKLQSPRTEHLSSSPLLSSLPSESPCLLPCILLLLLLHTVCSSNLSSHHIGRKHL